MRGYLQKTEARTTLAANNTVVRVQFVAINIFGSLAQTRDVTTFVIVEAARYSSVKRADSTSKTTGKPR